LPQNESEAQVLTTVNQGVATITLNRPNAMNAFAGDMREKLRDSLCAAAALDDIGCVVIIGAGKAFCAGGDVGSMVDLQDRNDDAIIGSRVDVSGEVLQQIRDISQPVVAAVNGPAAGAGMNLALACDIRIATDTAIFSESFIKIGLVPDWGGFQSLARLVGTAKAMELMMTGDRIDAAEALRLGMVNKVIPVEDFRMEVEKFATRLAAGPRAALAAIKKGTYLGSTGTAEEVLDFERAVQTQLFLSDDAREGMKAFVEKRSPKFGKS
jgi:2-(1,2-epoxy-1,2-dihydrophenyl)acetyl-CoA isomerase